MTSQEQEAQTALPEADRISYEWLKRLDWPEHPPWIVRLWLSNMYLVEQGHHDLYGTDRKPLTNAPVGTTPGAKVRVSSENGKMRHVLRLCVLRACFKDRVLRHSSRPKK